jgi:hypothetical protein
VKTEKKLIAESAEAKPREVDAEVLGAGATIRVDGRQYHHTLEAADGRWIYEPVRPRD